MKRYLLISVGLSVLFATSVYFSARAGYNAAKLDSMQCTPGADSVEFVAILERLHAGDVAQAQSLLESRLDSDFVGRLVYDRRTGRLVSLIARPTEPDFVPALIGTAAKYRLEHPSSHPSADVRSSISVVVAKYSPLAINPRTSPN
jgi:hypothetical protein